MTGTDRYRSIIQTPLLLKSKFLLFGAQGPTWQVGHALLMLGPSKHTRLPQYYLVADY